MTRLRKPNINQFDSNGKPDPSHLSFGNRDNRHSAQRFFGAGLFVGLHFGIWRSAVSEANLRWQLGHSTRSSCCTQRTSVRSQLDSHNTHTRTHTPQQQLCNSTDTQTRRKSDARTKECYHCCFWRRKFRQRLSFSNSLSNTRDSRMISAATDGQHMSTVMHGRPTTLFCWHTGSTSEIFNYTPAAALVQHAEPPVTAHVASSTWAPGTLTTSGWASTTTLVDAEQSRYRQTSETLTFVFGSRKDKHLTSSFLASSCFLAPFLGLGWPAFTCFKSSRSCNHQRKINFTLGRVQRGRHGVTRITRRNQAHRVLYSTYCLRETTQHRP